MPKSFSDLRRSLPPARQEKISSRTEELLKTLRLNEIRQIRQLSQEEVAIRLQVRQAAISKVENRDDLLVSTLRRHVEAMGGRLIIQAEFPEGRYKICGSSQTIDEKRVD